MKQTNEHIAAQMFADHYVKVLNQDCECSEEITVTLLAIQHAKITCDWCAKADGKYRHWENIKKQIDKL